MTTASPALPFLAVAETAELEDWGPLPKATGELGAGDTALFPKGWTGTWQLREPVRKLYVLF